MEEGEGLDVLMHVEHNGNFPNSLHPYHLRRRSQRYQSEASLILNLGRGLKLKRSI